MAIKRFSSTFKTRNDVLDNITPNNVVQPLISNPAGEWKPARYLPVQWTGEASKDAFVISSGKVVCMDTTGRISDMNILAAARALVAGTPDRDDFSADINVINGTAGNGADNAVVTYDSTDVSYGVYSIATGQEAAAGAVFIDEVAQGLLDQGLVSIERDLGGGTPFSGSTVTLEDNGSKAAADLAADCLLVIEAFFSDPVGIAAYDVFVWAGDTPAELAFTNYQKQHLIQFITEVQLKLPLIAGPQETAAALSSAYSSGDLTIQAAGTYYNNTQLTAFARYSDLAATVQGIQLDSAGICRNTDRTPIEDQNGLLTRSRSSVALLAQSGDFFVDADVGMILMYDSAADWTAGDITSSNLTSAIYHFTKVGASGDYRHVHMVGPCRPGDKLSYDDQSNFCVLGATDVDAKSASEGSIGRVMEIITEPKGLLDRVTTAFAGSSFSASAKMPGSATKGFSDMITLSGEIVADELVTVIVRF